MYINISSLLKIYFYAILHAMKSLLVQYKMLLIFIVDLATAFGALALMICIRYGLGDWDTQLQSHLIPFTIITLLFTLVFYIFNLYSFRFNKNITEFTNSFVKSLIISFILSVLIFYTFGNLFKLTPKTNLILFTFIFGIIDFYLRIIIKRSFIKNGIGRKVVIISDTENKLVEELEHNQNIGYAIVAKNKDISLEQINNLSPDVVAIDTDKVELDKIYSLVKRGTLVYTINNFYEEIFQKVPTDKLKRDEIIAHMSSDKTVFNFAKRILDIVLSIILIVIFSPILLITFCIIKTTSKGPSLFKHKRISLNDSEFTIYKFRSMYLDAEKNGAVWTENINTDPRITPFGKFIRKTHLDELPQLFNILKGDLSFVGPRPERPEFVSKLKNDILYYDLRHSVKAGLTGWAQVNYKYGASVEDAKEKLKYDFYYMKNRSIFFDLLIILKTVAEVFRF